MDLTVTGQHLCGETIIMASKSNLHRLLICAALSKGSTKILGATFSKDIFATVDCLRSFAADIVIDKDIITVKPYSKPKYNPLLDCNESGSTLRFLLPIIAALGVGGSFIGRGRLSKRPLSPLYELLQANGCKLSPEGSFPLSIEGRLHCNSIEIDGNISSQFISGLLLAAPLLNKEFIIKVKGKLESYPYIKMTLDTMKRFGVEVAELPDSVFKIPSDSQYNSPGEIMAEGDWSNAAFWLVSAAITKSYDYTISNLNHSSLQGDMSIVTILHKSGVEFEIGANTIRVCAAEHLSPLNIDVSDIPDLVPVIAVFACGVKGKTKIYNAKRLIYKESNRLQTVFEMITALGGKIEMNDDGLTIEGTGKLRGGTVNSYNDHRIAMSAAVASLISQQPVTIIDAEAVEKSYPDFFDQFKAKGMVICPPPSETD